MPLFVKDDPFFFQQLTLQEGADSIAVVANAALAVDHPLPGHIAVLGPVSGQRTADPAGGALPYQPGDLAVSGDLAGGDLTDNIVDLLVSDAGHGFILTATTCRGEGPEN